MNLTALVLSVFWAGATPLAAATCTPVSATLCVGVDDFADIWINGVCVHAGCVDSFAYVDGSSGTPITCVSVDPAILSPSGNYMAVRVRNTAPTEMWGTWALDILCSGGLHSYITSNHSFEFYHDPSGTAPPPLEGGLPWTDPAYVPSTPWGSPSTVTGSVYGKRATDPQTGMLLPPRSWNSSGSGTGPNVMYFRQGFGLTPAPTPVPPALSLQVIQPTCNAHSGQTFTVTLRVCNSGGNLTQTASVVLERGPENSFCGPWSPSGYSISHSGTQTTLSLPAVAGGGCVDYDICLVDYYVGPSEEGEVRLLNATLTWPGGTDSGGASIVAGPVCVPLSPTITRTFTPVPAASPTPTISPTHTFSPTPSASPTPAPPSPTFTATLTATPSASFTASPTATASPTPPPPPTPAPTATATPPPLLLTPRHPNPSPAREAAYIPYVISADAEVDIRVFDVSGELVLALGPVFQLKGARERRWDLVNSAGRRVASGVYLCRIIARSPQGDEVDAWVKVAVSR